MKDKFPEIYKKKIESLKSKIQQDFYYHATAEKNNNIENSENKDVTKVDKSTLLEKINNIFKRPDFIYQTDVIIMYKNKENIKEKIVGKKDNYLIDINGKRIYIDDIYDIK